MSDLKPNKYGGQKMPSKTSLTELRVTNPDAELAYDSDKFQTAAVVTPGSLSFQPSASQAEVKHGVTAVTHERHMSERSSGFQCSFQERSAIMMALQNMTSVSPVYVPATTGFTQGTIQLGSTAIELSLVSASGLTTDDLVYATFNSGELTEFEEERYIKNVSSNTVKLRHAFSQAPVADTLLNRAIRIEQAEAGADFKERHFNLKTSADDSSIHVLDYPSAVVGSGTPDLGSNSQAMGAQLNITANATEYTYNGETIPRFSSEYLIPRNVAKAL